MQDKNENAVREEIGRAVVDVPMREQRSLATVTAEIRTIRAARDKMFLEASVEIGRRLKEAKELVGHGGWGDYCKTELDFSQQTAQNHIRLFEAYAADQIRLDGAALKSKTLGDLSYTQALELLALPSEEEREAFVREHDMAKLSTRELREELRRRTGGDPSTGLEAGPHSLQTGEVSAADGEAGAARPSLQEIDETRELKLELIRANSRAKDAEAERDRILRETAENREKLDAANAEREAARQKSQEAEAKAQNLAADLAAARQAMKKALDAKAKAEKELKDAKADRTVPAETLEQLRREAEEAAQKALEAESGGQSLREAQAQYAKAEKEAAEARQEAARARQEAERLEKELRMAEPKVVVFRDRFAGLQGDLSALICSIDDLPADKQIGARKGVRAILQNALNMVQEPEEGEENHG